MSTHVTTTDIQSLTGKSISGASNTLSNIPQSAVTSLTTDLATKVQLAGDLGGTVSAPVVKNVIKVFNVADYGATGNGKKVTNAAMTSGSATLTSATAGFVVGDVGKRVVVVGAGAAGANVNTTISTFTSSTQVTLATTAGTTVSGATLYWGANEGAAITSAYTAASSGGEVYFPAGIYLSSTSIVINKSSTRTSGVPGRSILVCASSTSPIIYVDGEGVGATGVRDIVFRDLTVDCAYQTGTAGIQVRAGSYSTGDFVSNVRFEDCTFLNSNGSTFGAIKVLGGRGSTDRGRVTGIYVTRCVFDGAKFYHLYLDGGQIEDFHVSRCRFLNSIYSSIGWFQPAKKALAGFDGTVSSGIRSNKNWSINDNYFNNPGALANHVRDINKTGVRNLDILNNTFDVGYSGDPIYAYCNSIEGGNWGSRVNGNTFWRAYKCISIGQSNNGPWFQTNPTFMSEVAGNKFFQVHEVFDHDSDCAADIHDNTFYETATTAYNANYGRHSMSKFYNNTIINCPTVTGVGSENAAVLVSPMGQDIHDNVIVDNRLLSNPTTGPVLSQIAGGTLPARTYFAMCTWENDTGETLASSESSFAVSANNLLKITHAYTTTYGPPEGAKRINWYVSTSTGTETKQGYSWLPWAQEYELYPVTQQAVEWTEPATGLIAGTALPGTNTTHPVTQYGIYELSGESAGLMIYPNIYSSNKFMGLVSNEIYVGSSAYKRVQKNNWTLRDLTFGSGWQLLEVIPYLKGNVEVPPR